MNNSRAKVGLSADLFNSKGEPMFGAAPLALLSEAGLAWTIVPTQQGRLSPSAFTDYEALMIGGSRVSGAELVGESGKLRVIARNGVGYDAVNTQALSGHGILLTNTPVAVRTPVATTAVAFILALSLRLPVKSRLAREGPMERTRGSSWRRTARAHAWHCRTWGHRTRAGPSDAALRNDDSRRRSSRRQGRRSASGRQAHRTRRSPQGFRFRRRRLPLERVDAAPFECRPPAPDETVRLSHQRGARADHRRIRIDRDSCARAHRRRGAGRF